VQPDSELQRLRDAVKTSDAQQDAAQRAFDVKKKELDAATADLAAREKRLASANAKLAKAQQAVERVEKRQDELDKEYDRALQEYGKQNDAYNGRPEVQRYNQAKAKLDSAKSASKTVADKVRSRCCFLSVTGAHGGLQLHPSSVLRVAAVLHCAVEPEAQGPQGSVGRVSADAIWRRRNACWYVALERH
jgi:hypothetical protein